MNYSYVDLEDLSTDTIIQWWMNAEATCSCLGHFKAEQNRFFSRKYEEELSKRGVSIEGLYDKDKASFNGDGSY